MSVTVIGDAFIDIIVPIQGIEPGGTYHRDILVTCGGTATTAVYIARLGEKASFLGRVGNDALGKYFKENLKKNGVKDMTVVDDHQTGLCIALPYSNGERSMVADRGANNYLTAHDITQRQNAVFKSQIIYLSGYSLARMDTEETLSVLGRCREHGCQVWFNPGAPNLITDSLKHTIYQFFDALILNIAEAKTLTGGKNIAGMKGALEQLANPVVITLGKEGCVVLRAGQHPVSVGGERVPDIRDTTGAGDAFAAGFIVGQLRQLPAIECARLANQTAAHFLEEKARPSQ